MSRMPWFRVYSDILSDRKIKRVCKITGEPRATVIGVWITILALGNDSPERGKLQLCEGLWLAIEELEEETQLDIKVLEKLLAAFRELKMINGEEGEMEITNWQKRQFKSDYSTDRVRAHRERQKRDNETLQERDKGVIDVEGEEESEEEADGNVGKLVDAFVTASKIPSFGIKPRDNEAGKRMVELGITPEDVTTAVEEMLSKGLNMTGLASVENPSYIVRSKREIKPKEIQYRETH